MIGLKIVGSKLRWFRSYEEVLDYLKENFSGIGLFEWVRPLDGYTSAVLDNDTGEIYNIIVDPKTETTDQQVMILFHQLGDWNMNFIN